MKKFKISLVVLAVLMTGVLSLQTTYAREPSAAVAKSTKQLNKIIKESVPIPGYQLTGKEEGADVFVTFMLTDIGQIKVLKVTAPSQRLEEYVKEKLSDVTAKDVIHPLNQQYKVRLRFLDS